jgi:cytochrome c553
VRACARPILLTLAALALTLGVGGAALLWSGVIDVGARRGHFPFVEKILEIAMRQSARRHATKVEAPDLTRAGMVELGAAHFHSACALCHGTPEAGANPVMIGMLPAPPNLAHGDPGWSAEELFWIVRNGIKYTGMPGWPSAREDDVWPVVAFLRALPNMDAARYRRLALGELAQDPRARPPAPAGDRAPDAMDSCARCHGETEPPPSALTPRLHGQSEAMLHAALRGSASGERESGIMRAAVAGMNDADLRALARHYARGAPRPPHPSPNEAAVERGRRLAHDGDPARRIPACLGCHGPARHALIPGLEAQSAAYLESRLNNWRAGGDDRTPIARLMAPIARRLQAEDARAAAAYFASLAPPQRSDAP